MIEEDVRPEVADAGLELSDVFREVMAVRQLIEGMAGAQPAKTPDDVLEELAERCDEIRFLRRVIDRLCRVGEQPDMWMLVQVALQDYPHCLRDTRWQLPYRDELARVVAAVAQGMAPVHTLSSLKIGEVDRLAQSRRVRRSEQ